MVPRSIEPYVAEHDAVLLANHGAAAWGSDLWAAFDKLETVEHTAKIYRNVELLGGGCPLTPQQVRDLKDLKGYYRRLAGKRED